MLHNSEPVPSPLEHITLYHIHQVIVIAARKQQNKTSLTPEGYKNRNVSQQVKDAPRPGGGRWMVPSVHKGILIARPRDTAPTTCC